VEQIRVAFLILLSFNPVAILDARTDSAREQTPPKGFEEREDRASLPTTWEAPKPLISGLAPGMEEPITFAASNFRRQEFEIAEGKTFLLAATSMH
jgi:hypothetical protein